LEVVVAPVSDVDRAKQFYASLGWRLVGKKAVAVEHVGDEGIGTGASAGDRMMLYPRHCRATSRLDPLR
jgi:catechol 2,3-dioxygenase-like lactoylglutathione lyase family enzyme